MKKTVILIMLFGIFGCKTNQKKDFVFEEFKSQIENVGMKIDTVDKTGLIHVSKGELTMKISLNNVRKNYERDKDKSHVSNFIQSLLSNQIELIKKEWSEVRDSIYISLSTNDFDFEDEDVIHKKITEEFSKIYVYISQDQRIWINRDIITRWGITEVELDAQANNNADKLLEQIQISYGQDEKKLGWIEEKRTAALLFAPGIKEKVKSEIGFPFYAVIPVIDLCFIFSEKDYVFFSERIGEVVIEEYTQSGYPITTEILKFTDNGVKAVAKYQLTNDRDKTK